MDELEKIYSENRVAMKKIKSQTTKICIAYALYLCFLPFLFYFSIMLSPKYLIGALFVIAGAVTGFWGLYKHDVRLSKTSLVIIIVQFVLYIIMGSSDISDVFEAMIFSLPGYAVIGYFAFSAIKCAEKYNWLEQQDGFPNFEVRQAMYDMEKRQRAIKDPYAIKKEEIEKRSRQQGGGMEEI